MANSQDSAAATSNDDLKAKFRQALDKKKGRHHASAEGDEHDGSNKSHGTTGPVEARAFRRKSV